MEYLQFIYGLLLKKIDLKISRYLMERINWDARLIAITGPRGTGKTTLMLQRIKMQNQEDISLYASVDHVYFSKNSIVELADESYKYGIRYLYLDEVHKYKNWSQEIKNIYDSYPDMKIVFSGNSLIDVYQGIADLSRRVVPYFLKGLSFREYLIFENIIKIEPISFNDILQNKVNLEIENPLLYFKNYLKKGYYPFYKEEDFETRLDGVINTVIESDIPKYMSLRTSTIDKLKMLLQIIVENVPFKPNYAKLAELVGVSRNSLPDYFSLLEKSGLIMLLHNNTSGVRSLGKVQKVFMDNTNLSYALSANNVNIGNIRETFFMNQLKNDFVVKSPSSSDFIIDDIVFEIGGKNKSKKQIKGIKNSYVVKDEIEVGFGKSLPLWHFGMMY